MTTLRLLADDLTGALDTAAEFVPLAGSLPVFWQLPASLPPSCAIDSGTREVARAEADAALGSLAPALGGAMLAYKKIDSLLRGHTMTELAACLRAGAFDACIVAPAFPHQGRITQGGVQRARRVEGGWDHVADIVDLLAQAGLMSQRGEAGSPLQAGVSVFDARSEADLRAVAACGRASPLRVLWCGSAGLAQALCADLSPACAHHSLEGPVLGLFGSDQEATRRQLEACDPAWLRLTGDGRDCDRLAARLADASPVLASLDLPAGLTRGAAAGRIAEAFGEIVRRVARPGTLIVAGGETLRGLCAALGTDALDVQGQIEPGLPVSVMRGGAWDGVTVVSKSGAFGGPTLWRDLLATHGFLPPQGLAAEKVSA